MSFWNHYLAFDDPRWLGLLALLPLIAWMGRRSLAGLGRVRRHLALAARLLVALVLILALAQLQWVRRDEQLTVFYLVDRSLSIPPDVLPRVIDFVNQSLADQQHRRPEDRTGVIVFGRDAAIELPPLENMLQLSSRIESQIDPEGTDLAAALRLARAAFPPTGSKRVVVISDGNETRDNALAEARVLAEAGIGIDVVPLYYPAQDDIRVEKVVSPGMIRPRQPFDLSVVIHRTAAGDSDTGNATETSPANVAAEPIQGRLRIVRRTEDREVLLGEQRISLPVGKRVLTLRQELDEAGFHTFDVQFLPDDPRHDRRLQNNRAQSFTLVGGRGKVLLIENAISRGEFTPLVDALRKEELEVVVRGSDRPFTSLAELQAFDTVILANVPRTASDQNQQLTFFSDEQIAMLAHNTHNSGSGLVMIGGPESFGAGGWTGTKIEEAMPVEFRVDNLEVRYSGALALVIDRSGSMSGDNIRLARSAAIEAAKQLGPDDYIYVVAFDTESQVIVPLTKMKDAANVLKRIGGIEIGGGTDLNPGMRDAQQALLKADAAAKHMIILTDGHTPPGTCEEMARQMATKKITVSTVALGQGADAALLRNIARRGGGVAYKVNSPKAIPRIFMHEARRVSRPVVYENRDGFTPRFTGHHEITQGLGTSLPPITGLVLTRPKANSLVEVPVLSTRPDDVTPLLATWTYGVGRAVAFTTDGGARWTQSWPEWDGYGKFFNQLVRWSMRPNDSGGNFMLATTIEDGRAQVVVTAIDDNDQYLNFLNLSGSILSPEMNSLPLALRQVAPGRYVGDFPTDDAGGYYLSINTRAGAAPIRAGVVVPYAAEFSDQGSNDTLLLAMAAMQPRAGQSGQVLPLDYDQLLDASAQSTFRRDLAQSARTLDIWHWLLLGALGMFVGDITVRRVSIPLMSMLATTRQFIASRLGKREAAASPMLDRLRVRKAEVTATLKPKASERFETSGLAGFGTRSESTEANTSPGIGVDPSLESLLAESANISAPTKPQPQATAPQNVAKQEESYTSRLLAAKRKVWQERDQQK